MSENNTKTLDENTTPPAVEAASPAKPKLSDGLFKEYTLGSRLVPGSSGNVITNVKAPLMDYQKRYENSTKNQQLSADELSKLKPEPIKKSLNPFENVPEEAREKVLAEIDARIEKAKEGKDEKKQKVLEKVKDKAKKCWGPQMDKKQPKA